MEKMKKIMNIIFGLCVSVFFGYLFYISLEKEIKKNEITNKRDVLYQIYNSEQNKFNFYFSKASEYTGTKYYDKWADSCKISLYTTSVILNKIEEINKHGKEIKLF